jgi:hypothetical protein
MGVREIVGLEIVGLEIVGLLTALCAVGCGGGSARPDSGGAGGGSGTGVGAADGVAGNSTTGGTGTGGGSGGRTPVGSWPPAMMTNDAATLTGPMVGKCDGSAPRRKKIPLVINGGSPDFGYGDMYLVQSASDTTRAALYGLVTNLGSTMRCNISAPPNGYDWYDGQGRSMNVTGSPTVIGSEGDVGTSIYVQSCLAPGETGILLGAHGWDALGSFFDAVGSVSLALTYSGDGAVPAASVVPERYTVSNGSTDSFVVWFRNIGTATAFLARFGGDGFPGIWVAFDDDGLPLSWGRFWQETMHAPGTYTLAPGEEGTGGASSVFPGCATQLRAYVAFYRADAVQ